MIDLGCDWMVATDELKASLRLTVVLFCFFPHVLVYDWWDKTCWWFLYWFSFSRYLLFIVIGPFRYHSVCTCVWCVSVVWINGTHAICLVDKPKREKEKASFGSIWVWISFFPWGIYLFFIIDGGSRLLVEVIAELDIDGMAWPYLYRFAEQNQRSLISFPPLLISPYRIVYFFYLFCFRTYC